MKSIYAINWEEVIRSFERIIRNLEHFDENARENHSGDFSGYAVIRSQAVKTIGLYFGTEEAARAEVRLIASPFIDRIYRMVKDDISDGLKEDISYIQELIERAHTAQGDCTLKLGRKAFVVHGHDQAMRTEAENALFKLGINPVVLSDQVDEGLTIIEKLEKHSIDIGFAVFLVSPDDLLVSTVGGSAELHRARQNVLFEWGYFLGMLDRARVFTLVKDREKLDIHSDMSGVLVTPYDSEGRWCAKLKTALETVGYTD